ncbi:MAG: thioredoxin domain-containing protein [Coriobacteriia bacterium]|nr:thioredoxin domain-containing protein [Coriobacteriia bacterium]
MPNRLAHETSPYLLQHAENPVDWYPWGPEAFERARAEDKPVFLSVGYSACHWCHVMEQESFEDEATALLLNTNFVPVKVDREERPDVDSVYMDAVNAVAGRGGWPMSVFLTPAGEPFYAGTYFPATGRQGMVSFREVLDQLAGLWETQRDEVLSAAARLTADIRSARDALASSGGGELPGAETLHDAATRLAYEFDEDDGGWGGPPKFPQPMVVEFLLRRYRQTDDGRLMRMVSETLDAMAAGGLYDQLGGGFHRYATDLHWRIPHFEKMLTDNAQLARVYLAGWELTGLEHYRRVATDTLDYLLREMADPAGGFYSAQDADTEGEEGRFFVWTPQQVTAALEGTPEAADGGAELFCSAYGVTREGNFEGSTVLHLPRPLSELASETGIPVDDLEIRLAAMRRTLFEARESRVRPARDEKVLAGWNGLALGAFATAARVLDRSDYREAAERTAHFLLGEMMSADGRVYRSWKEGRAALNGYLEDYANVAEGLLELFETTGDERWLTGATELAGSIVEHFSDPAGGFFDTSDDHEQLIVRPKVVQDGAVPSGGAMATGVLLRLAVRTRDARYADPAAAALRSVGPVLSRAPLGFAKWLTVFAGFLEEREQMR